MYDRIKCHADTNDDFICEYKFELNLKDFDKARESRERRESSSMTRNPGIDLQSK